MSKHDDLADWSSSRFGPADLANGARIVDVRTRTLKALAAAGLAGDDWYDPAGPVAAAVTALPAPAAATVLALLEAGARELYPTDEESHDA